MGVKATLLTSGGTTTETNSFTTATISPKPNKLILISVGCAERPAPIVASVTGCGLTFTAITNCVTGDGYQRNTLLRAVSSSTSTGTLTITLSGNSDSTHWIVTEYDNTDIGGTNASNAIVQSATTVLDSPPTTGTVTVTLGAFSNVNNATFGAMRLNSTGGTGSITPGSGFTELAEVNVNHQLENEFKDSNDTSVDWSYTGTGGRITALAVELKYKAPAGGAFLYHLI
jgi:hypothetical protein